MNSNNNNQKKKKSSSKPPAPKSSCGLDKESVRKLRSDVEEAMDYVRFDKPASGARLKGGEEVRTLTSAGTGFSGITIGVNPGNEALLPLAHAEARIYSRYRFRHLTVKFVPSVSGYAAGGQAGNLILVWVPEVTEDFPVDLEAVARTTVKSPIVMAHEHSTLKVGPRDFDRLGARYPKVRGVSGWVGDPEEWESGTIMICWEGISTGMFGRIELRYELEVYDKFTTGLMTAPTTGKNMFSSSWQTVNVVATGVRQIHTFTSAGSYPYSPLITPSPGSGISLSLNEFTCQAGLYLIRAEVAFIGSISNITSAEIRLENSTDTIVVQEFQYVGGATSQIPVSGSWVVNISGPNTYGLWSSALFASGTVSYSGNLTVSRIM